MKDTTDVKYIRITDFDDEGIPPNHEFVTASTVDECYRLENEDILFARSGATAGKTYIHNEKIGPAIFAGYCIRFRFDPIMVLPKHVYYYTKTNRYKSWVQSIQRPSGQPNINKEEFKSFTIPLPPLDVQKKLVDEVEAARESRKKKLQIADELLGGLDEWVMNKLGLKLPLPVLRHVYALKLSQLKDVQRFNPDYFHPERLNAIRAINTAAKKLNSAQLSAVVEFRRDICENTPAKYYVGLANVQSRTGELVQANDEAEGQCFCFQKNDVLFARLRPYLNKVFCAERDGVCSTEFHVMRVLDSDDLLQDYLAVILRSELILAQTRHMMTGNTHPRLTNDDVTNLVIPIPTLRVQQSIADEVLHRRNEARRLRAEADSEWAAAKERFEQQLLGDRTVAATDSDVIDFRQEKKSDGNADNRNAQRGGVERQSSTRGKEEKISRKHPEAGARLHGVRRRAGKPEDAGKISEESEEYRSTTRFIESSLGIKSYAELAPYLAQGVERVMVSLLDRPSDQLVITPDFIRSLHRDAFYELFPSRAGSYRDRDVTVGRHKAPAFFEVPLLMRHYCADLEARFAALGEKPLVNDLLLETLAFAEGRFLSIHPFFDFNGRVARMLLFYLLFRLDLPPVSLLPEEDDRGGRQTYFSALSEADELNYQPLIGIWMMRLQRSEKL